jgi:crotonobetainyl-CoA:carnitine CoA-transferase CaiB-like acyl-CoA transferase
MEDRALSDLKIVELGHLISGPYCAKLLADLGAEVIKVEEPGLGDEARRREPFLHDEAHPEKSGLFLYLNTNKLGVTLNLKSKTGRDIFHKLVKEADVLVENNRPSVMDELGLQYENLKEINPRLIMTSITPFGQSGPYRNYKATELISYHMGMIGYSTPGVVDNPAEEPPLRAGGQVADFMAGIAGAVATMCAVFYRQATGLGEHVDVSTQEAVASFARTAATEYLYTKQLYGRARGARPYVGFAGMLPCKDGYVNLSPSQDHHWDGLVQLMGNPEWAQDERFKNRDSRREHGEEIRAHLEEWTKGQNKVELAEAAQRLGFPGAPIYTIDEALNAEHLLAREFLVQIEHPEAGRIRYPGAPFKLWGTPWRVICPAPLLGQHNEEVYCRRLGYSKEKLVKFRESGVI